MSTNDQAENEICEACGTFGEIGYIIKEGDNVADVKVMGGSPAELQAELENYIQLAKQVCANVRFEVDPVDEEAKELTARFEFEVSAEKIIFELKSRSLIKN